MSFIPYLPLQIVFLEDQNQIKEGKRGEPDQSQTREEGSLHAQQVRIQELKQQTEYLKPAQLISMKKKQDSLNPEILIFSGDFKLTLVINISECSSYVYNLSLPLPKTVKKKQDKLELLNENIELWGQQKADMYTYLHSPHVSNIYRYECFDNSVSLYLSRSQMILSEVFEKNLKYSSKILIMQSIAECVSFVHKKDVILRDLRPDTIGIDRLSRDVYKAKIVVLREAVHFCADKKQKIPPANFTSQYSAPEARYRSRFGIKSDIWSLGLIFYEFLFGTQEKVYFQNEETKIKFPSGTPQWLCQIFKKMLAYKQIQRYSINDTLNRLKFLRQCSETAQKIIPKW